MSDIVNVVGGPEVKKRTEPRPYNGVDVEKAKRVADYTAYCNSGEAAGRNDDLLYLISEN